MIARAKDPRSFLRQVKVAKLRRFMNQSIKVLLIPYICLKAQHGYHFERPSNIFLFQLSAADVVLLISMVTQQFYESPKNFPFQQSLCKAIYGTDCFAQD